MSTAMATLSRKAFCSAGFDTMPRSPAGMSPAAKLSPVNCTPASWMARMNAVTSASDGVGVANGHQNSTAEKPASLAAAGRSSSGRSVSRIEQLTV